MKNNKGFTLIELLVVVAIIGALAAVGVVAYNGYTAAAKKNSSKAIHANVVKYISSELAKCNLGTVTSLMGVAQGAEAEGGDAEGGGDEGGGGGAEEVDLDCDSPPTDIVDHLVGDTSPLQDKNPYETGEAAVNGDGGKGFTQLTATDSTATTGKIKILTQYDENATTDILENEIEVEQVKVKTRKTFEGFTLVELLVVVAIIGILGAVGTVAYNGYTKGARVTAAKNTLMQISLAQTEHFSNAGYYWTNDEACADTYTKAAGKALNEEVGEGLFTKKNYIDSKIEFYFCI